MPTTSTARRALRGLLAATALFLSTGPAVSGPASVEDSLDDLHPQDADRHIGFRYGSVIVAPVPFSNPTIGSGLALGAGYLFKTDPNAKTSVIGLGAMRSDNGSEAYGAVANLAFGNNKWLFNSFIGKADVVYDLYTPVAVIPIRQTGTLGRASLAYGVTPQLSFGAAVRYLETTITPNIPGLPPIPPEFQPDLGLKLALSSLTAEWDTRDDTDYPTFGHRLKTELSYGSALDGPSLSYQKATASFDKYWSLSDTGVVALRGTICGASEDTPFFDKCALGPTDGFRGFSATQFLDRRLLSVQAEFRQRLSKRFGMVAFAGTGWVGPGLSGLDDGGSHSAAGLGLRYRVSKKFPVDFSIDYARNDLEDNLLYIYVGQRF